MPDAFDVSTVQDQTNCHRQLREPGTQAAATLRSEPHLRYIKKIRMCLLMRKFCPRPSPQVQGAAVYRSATVISPVIRCSRSVIPSTSRSARSGRRGERPWPGRSTRRPACGCRGWRGRSTRAGHERGAARPGFRLHRADRQFHRRTRVPPDGRAGRCSGALLPGTAPVRGPGPGLHGGGWGDGPSTVC